MDEYPEFAALEREGWRRADISGAYAERFARATEQAIPSLVAAAEAGPGRRVLDLCCGHGALTAALAGAGAEVTGLDFSPAMLEIARRRAPGAELVQGDAAELPFENASFDALTCGFGLMHVPDQPKALAEAARVLRPGGRLALAAWIGADGSDFFAIAGAAIAEAGDPDVALPPAPDFHRFADPAQSDPLLEAAGFRDISRARLDLKMPLEGPEELFDLLRHATVRVSMLLDAQPEARRAAIARAMAHRVRDWARKRGVETRGGFALPMPAALVAARR